MRRRAGTTFESLAALTFVALTGLSAFTVLGRALVEVISHTAAGSGSNAHPARAGSPSMVTSQLAAMLPAEGLGKIAEAAGHAIEARNIHARSPLVNDARAALEGSEKLVAPSVRELNAEFLRSGDRVAPWESNPGTARLNRECRGGCVLHGTAVATETSAVPIQNLRVGQRVLGAREQYPKLSVLHSTGSSESDAPTLRRVVMNERDWRRFRFEDPMNREFVVELMRPRGWLDEAAFPEGSYVSLRVPDLGVDAERLRLTEVSEATIEPGRGRVLLGTVDLPRASSGLAHFEGVHQASSTSPPPVSVVGTPTLAVLRDTVRTPIPDRKPLAEPSRVELVRGLQIEQPSLDGSHPLFGFIAGESPLAVRSDGATAQSLAYQGVGLTWGRDLESIHERTFNDRADLRNRASADRPSALSELVARRVEAHAAYLKEGLADAPVHRGHLLDSWDIADPRMMAFVEDAASFEEATLYAWRDAGVTWDAYMELANASAADASKRARGTPTPAMAAWMLEDAAFASLVRGVRSMNKLPDAWFDQWSRLRYNRFGHDPFELPESMPEVGAAVHGATFRSALERMLPERWFGAGFLPARKALFEVIEGGFAADLPMLTGTPFIRKREMPQSQLETLGVLLQSGEHRGSLLGMTLHQLGPGFIKLAQNLAARGDLIGEDMRAALAPLTDRVPHSPKGMMRYSERVAELDLPVQGKPEILGSGSVAQVHSLRVARMDGLELVMKVIKPGAPEALRDNLNAMLRAIKGDSPQAESLRALLESLNEYAPRETDLRFEAAALERAGYNLSKRGGVTVPRVYPQKSSATEMLMEKVEGGSVIDHLPAAASARLDLAQRVFGETLAQIFSDGFFHGDPHRGNIFYQPKGRQLVYLDWGLSSEISAAERFGLVRLAFETMAGDPDRIVAVLKDVATRDGATDALRGEVTRVLGEEGDVLSRMQSLIFAAQGHGMRFPSAFGLAAKSIYQADGLARQISPGFDASTAVLQYLLKNGKKLKRDLDGAIRRGEIDPEAARRLPF